jgi:prolyl oligopeptidase
MDAQELHMTVPERPIVYPPARRVDVVDDYHGVRVADPYRWLEDLDAPDTRAWIDLQNDLTSRYLDGIPARDRIKRRLTALWDFEKYGTPFKRGRRYFFLKNDGLQNQFVLYTLDALDAPPRVLLDPNALSPDGTVALTGLAVSDDGARLAYGLSASGSDWQEWRVRDVATAADLEDHLLWVKFSGASWTKDGAGFFYSRYDEPDEEAMLEEVNYFQKLWYHRLGTPQSDDILVYERPDHKDWLFDGHVTEDGRYLIITVSQGTEHKNRVFYQELGGGLPQPATPPALTPRPSLPNSGKGEKSSPPPGLGEGLGVRASSVGGDGLPVTELLNDFDAAYHFVDNDGPVFWFQTDLDAPRGRVIAIDTRAPERSNWREIIPEAEETLEGVAVVHDTFIASYLQDAHTVVRLFDLEGRFLREVTLPGIGTAEGFGGRREDTETFYLFTSFTVPPTVYRYDMVTGESTVFRAPRVDFDPDAYETKQVFYTSRDGTRVPMFITHRKGLALDGANPTYLYGYGGFGISLTPSFSVGMLVWMELGGVYAVANLRGGGEYGEEWHQAGTKQRKQNVFDDFIAAAEWLIENGYTSSGRLAIGGGSNGGLLVAACMLQRPDLFGAVLPAVGVMDMLRFPKFTIGWAWISDYGSPDDPEDFRTLYAYSPYHNLRPGVAYPPVLITTGDHDDRVVPAHSFKFAAALQAAQDGPAPALIRIETKAGHGAGKPTDKLLDEIADRWAFLVKVFGIETPPSGPTM